MLVVLLIVSVVLNGWEATFGEDQTLSHLVSHKGISLDGMGILDSLSE
jgi:hypothetical protein